MGAGPAHGDGTARSIQIFGDAGRCATRNRPCDAALANGGLSCSGRCMAVAPPRSDCAPAGAGFTRMAGDFFALGRSSECSWCPGTRDEHGQDDLLFCNRRAALSSACG